MRSGAHEDLMSPLKIGLAEFNKASSDAGPELASSGSLVAMESPQALIAPLKGGMGVD